ncbi:hypothetical protein BAUCODRAFT_463152 [Baudoinia panamericana UAMH 10762]|uniref:Myb-like domain-containing protein n=1 Tax=Baudoinia panamericana (strain UAMH 10762) TaxID=717646 RepID=M2MM01_BAUPA|nr:uncharacterized protein BAUCODRAFT_463152 [Baudoinia panamericana UAMH 10762]EMC97706.1 hypothetical protein BAUCODRAFT_463152 [Baudoinia panamericana UAMH 10762]
MPGKGPWTDATDRQLLLTIIHLTAPQLPKWDEVAGLMGEGYTAESVRQHFQKLRKDTKAQFGEPTTPNGNRASPAKSIARKRKAGSEAEGDTPTGKKLTGKGRKGKHAAQAGSDVDADGDDDEDLRSSPSKKVKAEVGDGDELFM